MGKKRGSQRSEVDEPNISKKAPSSEKSKSSGAGSGSGSSSEVRRVTGEKLSKKQNNSSKGRVRRSERLEMQTPRTRSGKKKNHTHSSVTSLEGVTKIQSARSRLSGKDSTSKHGLKKVNGHSIHDVNDEKKFKTLKDICEEATDNGASKQGEVKPSLGVDTKRKTRLEDHADMEMIQPSKKTFKVSGSSKKTLQISLDVRGDNDSQNDKEVQREHDDVAELKEDCTNNNGDTGASDLEKKRIHSKEPEPCKSKDVNHLQICIPTSSGTETKKDEAEDMERDCSMIEKDKKIQNQEEHIASIEQSNYNDSLRCNLSGTMQGTMPAVGGECENFCVEDILPSVSSACKMSFLIGQCDKCHRKRRLDYNSPKEEFCCCLSNLLNDADITLPAKDSGECGTCVAVQLSDKHDQDMQLSDSPLHVEQSTCIMCKHPGNLLLCGGKGCRRGYHSSCLSTPQVDKLLIWYCSKCTEKKMSLGVHSVTEGIESVCDVRELQLLNCKGVENQKQYLVKYKGLSHIHNQWASETQLLHEVPELLTKFSERQEVQWKVEWTVPHRLLLKRYVAVTDCVAKHKNDCAGIVSDGQCEWLVKWVGLDYDQATWELEGCSCFKTPVMQRLIQDYETRHDKAKKLPISGDNEIQEKKKGSNVKSGKHSGGVLSGADSCHLNTVNKLREYHHKGHNAVLNDAQDRIFKVIHLVSSLITNVQGPFLIISPCASLSVWEMEFSRIDSSINVVTYCGSTDARKIARGLEFYEDGGSMMLQVLLSTAEVLSEDLEELKTIKWEAVILDDCQQSSISAHSVTFKKLAAEWKLLLLNADLKDNVSEYISVLSLLEPSDNAYQNLGLIDEASENLKMLKSKLSSHIVCPRFLEYWVPVQISNLQLEHYCSLILSNSTTLRSCTKSKDHVGTLREILFSTRKCCDHPYVVDPSLQSSLADGLPPDALLDLGIRGSGKLLFLDQILSKLRSLELKVLILYKSICGSGRDTTGDILDDFLRQRFGLDSYEHVDLTSSKKQAALDEFNRRKEISFFLLETRACFPSIKLSTVDAVIIFNSDWNPLNDLRSLQRIIIDSKLVEIKVFRLYCSCTIEEKVLQFAKDDMILESTLQGISRSTSHMLLMWGASHLFTKLDQFHCQNTLDVKKHMVPEDSFLKDVCNEILCLFQNHDTPNFTKFISVARHIGGTYGKNTSLIGEQKALLEDGILPHAFWTNLLEDKQPKWKYVLGCHRNRKRAHHSNDSPMPPGVHDVGTAKKSKKGKTQRAPSAKVARNLGKSKAEHKGYDENSQPTMANNAKSVDNIDLTMEKSSEPTLQCILNDIRQLRDSKMKFDDRMHLTSEQTELFQMLKPNALKLCEILLLKDDEKMMAEQFLEYIVKNHPVTREPETILQAFQISVCWTVAELMDQNMDHKKSLAIAREKMNFGCSEEEADFMYSKLKLLHKMFLLHSEVFRFPKASNNPSDINDIMWNLHKDAAAHEKNPLHVNCFGKQASKPVETTNNEISALGHLRKFKKKCDKLMKRLEDKQLEEVKELKKKSEEKKAELENNCRKEMTAISSLQNKSLIGVDKLRILDDTYTKKSNDLESQILAHRKELEARHRSEKDELQKKAAQWLKQVKSFAQKELSNKPTSENEQLPVEHLELTKLSNETSITGKRQDQNSKSGATGVLSHLNDTVVDSSEAIVVPEVVESGNSVLKDLLEESLDSAEKSSSFALKADQVDGNNTLLSCKSAELLASPGICSTDHPHIDIASMCPLSDNQGLEIEHCERAVGLEEQVPHMSEPLPSNLLCDECPSGVSDVTPSHGYHQEIDASGGSLNNEPCEFYTSDVTPIQREVTSAGIRVEASSQHVPAFAVDHAAEVFPSTTRNTLSPLVSPPNMSQLPTFTISQLPSLSSNPLQNELERTRGEIYQIMNIHEETKSRLKSECDKEIEEAAAQIRMKYDGKLKEANASFSFKRNELEMYHDKVMMHKWLAEAFKSKCFSANAESEMQHVISSRLSNPSSRSLPHNIVPAVRVVRPSDTVSNPTAGLLHINTVAQTAPHQPARRYAPSRLLETLGSASLSVSSSCMPPVSCSSSGRWVQQPPIGNQCAPSAPLHLPQDPTHSFRTSNGQFHINTVAQMAPHQPVRRYAPSLRLESLGSASLPVPSSCMPCVSYSSSGDQFAPSAPLHLPQDPTHSFRTSNGQFHFDPNSYISAMGLLMEIGRHNHSDHTNNVAPLTNTLQTLESLVVAASRASAETQLLTNNWNIANNVASLPNDIQVFESGNTSALNLPSSTSCEPTAEVVNLSDDE